MLQAWKEINEQLGFDRYLASTPHEEQSIQRFLPYELLSFTSTSTQCAATQAMKASQSALRKNDYYRRRTQPSCVEEACAYGNLSYVVLKWAQGLVDYATRHAFYEGSDASPLMWAAFKNHLPIVRFLIDVGAPLNWQSTLGHSALQWAILGGSIDVVRCLLDHGADPTLRDRQGFDAAFVAVQSNELAILLLLLEDERQARMRITHSSTFTDDYDNDNDDNDNNNKDHNSNRMSKDADAYHESNRETGVLALPSPSSTVCVSVHENIKDDPTTLYTSVPSAEYNVQKERTNNNNNNNANTAMTLINPITGKPYYVLDRSLRDVEGHSLLHWAAYRNSPSTCSYLIELWHYDVNACDKNGRTALIWAAREGFGEVLEILLSHNADTSVVDVEGCNAMQYALMRNHPEAVYVLTHFPQEVHVQSTTSSSLERAALPLHDKNNMLEREQLRNTFEINSQYIPLRVRRARGTLAMMSEHYLYAVKALSGLLWLFLFYTFTCVFPPLISYVMHGMYIFKNMLWTLIEGRPTQGSSGSGAGDDNKEDELNMLPDMEEMGMARSMYEALAGTWLFRYREPAALFLFVLFPFIQLCAWNLLGLSPLWSRNDNYSRWATSSTSRTATTTTSNANVQIQTAFDKYVYPFRSSLTTDELGRMQNVHNYLMGSVLSFIFSDATYMISAMLTLLLILTLLFMLLTKLFERKAMITHKEEGDWHNSPLWRIICRRQFQYLHPRRIQIERHTEIPLRTFYCPERDVLVRRYDGYSVLFDSPIGQYNHVFFVLTIVCFIVFELCLLSWGLYQASVIMQCNVNGPAWRGATLGLRSNAYLEKYVKSLPAYSPSSSSSSFVKPLMSNGANIINNNHNSLETATVAPYLTFDVFNPFLTLLSVGNLITSVVLFGLPCRALGYSNSLVINYVSSFASLSSTAGAAVGATHKHLFIRRLLFAFQYYIWPTSVNTWGVWLFQFSGIGILCGLFILVRQCVPLWNGVTRMEWNNPIAPGAGGSMVQIFPTSLQHAMKYPHHVNHEEEYYYAQTNPTKVTKYPRKQGKSIYASSRYGIVNLFLFLCGNANGHQWNTAMSVSEINTPVTTPMLTHEFDITHEPPLEYYEHVRN